MCYAAFKITVSFPSNQLPIDNYYNQFARKIYNMLPDMNKKPEKPMMIKMAGYLEKKGRMRVVGVRRWKKRWCVLEGKLLLYFKTQLEYTHQLSPCRGSVNMGLVLSVTLRGPCQLQIVTRSQIIILRTQSKTEQDQWYVALRDACNNNIINSNNINNGLQTIVRRREYHRKQPCGAAAGAGNCKDARGASRCRTTSEPVVDGRGRPLSLTESVDDAFVAAAAKRNGAPRRAAADRRTSAALRKCESDDRIRFYRQLHGLARVDATRTDGGEQQQQQPLECRSRSLSYESLYFKPQEPQDAEAIRDASRSCRELGPTAAAAASDGYDYVDAAELLQRYARNTHEEEPRRSSRPGTVGDGHGDAAFSRASSSATVAATDSDSDDREANVDVVYVNSDRKTMAELVMEYNAERTEQVDPEEEPPPPPPPLPAKKRSSRERPADNGAALDRRRRTADGRSVYVCRDGAEEVIYDVPIPHGELIEHFRRLTVAPALPVKRSYADNAVYDDSLEPSLYGTLHMTPDSLEIATTFPTYKRWSSDSGFNNYEEPNTFLPDQTHFEDSLEPVIAIMHHDRKIWQNVPNINSTDYFR